MVDLAGHAERFARLFRIAEGQAGYFTLQQAQSAGYSRQLLKHHLDAHRIERWFRGVYRLVHFPQQSQHEDLVIYWLWSNGQGVFTHETALSLHQLSDVLPARVHMTLPVSWSRRRLRVPPALELHFGEVPEMERQRIDGVPCTAPARTVNDCARGGLALDLLQQAVSEGLERKLFRRADLRPALKCLRSEAA